VKTAGVKTAATKTPMLSVIIPALNAATTLCATMASVAGDPVAETVVIDGGSTDATAELAAALGARVIRVGRGRGVQIAAGVAASAGPWLLVLHADTRLGTGWREAAVRHMHACPDRAGYFGFLLDSRAPEARRLERLVRWRCRVAALPYGDQGLLIPRDLLSAVGGVRPLPLMEDVDLVRRLGRRRLVGLDASALTSAEKWEREGWRRRSARNLVCLSLYLIGVPPPIIARLYA